MRSARRFRTATDGNIAVIFALALVPLLGFVGVAVDYSRANSARTAMQSALDSAALMVSRDLSSGAITADQVASKSQSYFDSLYTGTESGAIKVTATYTAKDSSGSSTIVLKGQGTVATDFMKIVGQDTVAIGSTTTTTWGGTRLRVAMALDVTGSMASAGKMSAMKTAAKGLVDTLRASAQSADDVYISVVPFAQMVNVGSSNRNASWVKWDVWEEITGSCSWWWLTSKASCENAGRTWSSANRNQWTGCVTDRDQPADTTKDAPTSNATKFPAADYDACPAQILGMTSAYSSSNATTIKNKIDALSPNGGTNQAIGMHWAWMSLLTGDPLNTPSKDTNYKYTDAIILLSDGMNTIDRWYGNGSSWSQQVDARQKILCDNIRASSTNTNPITIYTIQVNTDGDPESAVLKYCADTGNFFATTTASGIGTAFAQIGTSLSKLRLSK
jgi:Flp pilus assembly protein TadG